MNIKITFNWLLEYLDTDATPQELQKYLSLCGPGIERLEKHDDDWVMDIEITSNRVDAASVFGVAQEAQAVLTQFGKKAKLKSNPLKELRITNDKIRIESRELPLTIHLKDNEFAPRIIALALSGVAIGPSPELIKKRLEICGERAINNVIDISNYMRIALGQPCHIFDYDSVGDHTMIIRRSRKGEKITTLDRDEVVLPGDDIVIEDGEGKLIDQPGIMGAFNSSVTNKTKNIILLVPVFNGSMVRRTAMLTGKRSNAVSYFEKHIDSERAEAATIFALDLLQKNAGAKVSSKLIDIYPNPQKQNTINVDYAFVLKRIGVDISINTSKQILKNLGFEVNVAGNQLHITVPFWRARDIEIPEDIVEEIARIYGYHNLPSTLPPLAYIPQPKEVEELFAYQSKIKYFLRHLGLHESLNYSMVSKKTIEDMGLRTENHLSLANTISEELQYMRISLLPSLTKNILDNEGKRDVLQFFEIAKVYYPTAGDLPKEVYKLGIATNTSFDDLKGIMEALLGELRITNYELRIGNVPMFAKYVQVDFVVNGGVVGSIGKLTSPMQSVYGIKNPVYLAGFDLLSLIEHARVIPVYKPINPYATIKLDLNIKEGNKSFEEIKKESYEKSTLLQDIEVVDHYKDTVTLRFHFAARDRNIKEEEAQQELEKIKQIVS